MIFDAMKRAGILLALLFCASTFRGISQDINNGKVSISTQLFLKELKVKRAFVYDGNREKMYDSSNISEATTDDVEEDHGTHTASTAGGSSVIIDGNDVIVTDDHSSATYGGMAPGADLYLASIKDLSSTSIANAFYNIRNYADTVGMPLVLSNSWGDQVGPHDGSGEFAEIISQYFGKDHPNRICLFAAGNEAGSDFSAVRPYQP